jgi:hypothetical protein
VRGRVVFGVLEWRWYSWGKVVVVEVLSVQMDCCGMRQKKYVNAKGNIEKTDSYE